MTNFHIIGGTWFTGLGSHAYFSQWRDVAKVSLLKQCLVVLRAEGSPHSTLCDRLSGVQYHIVCK